MKLGYLLFILIISLNAQRAWICVPVADLIGQRMSSITPTQPILNGYTSMPHYGKGGWACPRIGQALFGQEVELEKIDGNEALIGIKNLFYESRGEKRNRYWTLKKNIITEKGLEDARINVNQLPKPIDFTDPSMKAFQNTLTLIEPWKGYSVGTRFVRVPGSDTKDYYSVWLLNPSAIKMRKAKIPKELCMIYLLDSQGRPYPSTSSGRAVEKNFSARPEPVEGCDGINSRNQTMRKCFVNLLKRWAHRSNAFIPYVWGGFSIRSMCKQDTFILDKKPIFVPFDVASRHSSSRATADGAKQEIRAKRPEKDHEYPKSGLDCSGLIAMAAQCCGLPYYYKNTTTIGKHLKELQPTDTIQAGDLIWFRGHVLAISSLSPAKVIESRGYTLKRYTPGCGKVHEVALEKVFKDMKTIEQLRAAFFEGKPLDRIDGYGDIGQVFGWKILKLL